MQGGSRSSVFRAQSSGGCTLGRTGMPVTTTLMGLGAFPGDHPLSLDMLGMHGSVYANLAVSEADLLLALGVRFDDRVTGNVEAFAKRCKIIHIDVDPSEINKIKGAKIAITSDIKYALTQLLKVAEPPADLSEWHKKITTWKEEDPLDFDHDSPNILVPHAIRTLWEMTEDRDPIISTGVGQHQMWTAQFFKFTRPRRWLSSEKTSSSAAVIRMRASQKLRALPRIAVSSSPGFMSTPLLPSRRPVSPVRPRPVLTRSRQHMAKATAGPGAAARRISRRDLP